jgi:nitrogen regulatory protein PII
MKLIMAFVKPFRLDHVREAMEEVGVDSFSFTEARGIGHHKGERDIYKGGNGARPHFRDREGGQVRRTRQRQSHGF